MRGMILAAGYGTRMGPISRYLAKPAVPFFGVPMIEHSIGVLRSGGITDIVINLHHLPQSIIDIVGDGKRFGVKVSYSHEDPLLGSGGGIGKVKEFLGRDTFIVLNSDVLIDIDLGEVIEAHRKNSSIATLLLRPDDSGMYGKVNVDEEGRVTQIEGHPEVTFNNSNGRQFMFAGLHVIEPRWFDYTPDREVYESFPDVYGPMLREGEKIGSFVFNGRWIDLGSARRLLAATHDNLVGNIIPSLSKIGRKSFIRHSVLTLETTIGENCNVEGVICLGKAEIGETCRISNSILCPGAEIKASTEAENRIFYECESIPLDELAY